MFQKLGKLKNTKRIRLNVTFRPQIATPSIAEFVVWAAKSAMVQICWLRVWLLWALIRISDAWTVLAQICRAGFSNYARIWELVSSSVQGRSATLLLCGLLLVWISLALGYLWKPDVLPSAFWKVNEYTELKEIDFIKRKVSYKEKPIVPKN